MSRKLSYKLSPKLESYLKKLNFDVYTLAHLADIPAPTLYRNLQKKTPMSLSTAMKILAVLEIELENQDIVIGFAEMFNLLEELNT